MFLDCLLCRHLLVRWPIGVRDFGLATCDLRLQTSDLRLQTSAHRCQRLRTCDLRLQTSDFRLRTCDFRLQTSDLRLQISDLRLQTSDLRLRTCDFRLRICDLRFQSQTSFFAFLFLIHFKYFSFPKSSVSYFYFCGESYTEMQTKNGNLFVMLSTLVAQSKLPYIERAL